MIAFDVLLRGELPGAMMKREIDAATRAVTVVIRRKTTTLKNALRRQVKRAGLGDKLPNAIRGDTIPRRGYALDIQGRIFSKAIVKGRQGGTVDLFDVFQRGVSLVTLNGQRAMAIPLPAAKAYGRGDRRTRAQPSDFPPGFLRWRPTRTRGVGLLVGKDGRAYFLTTRGPITIPRRLAPFDDQYQRVIADIPAQIVREWERQARKSGVIEKAA